MKKNAFSLAEVLITMAVIGVVAAITVPALVTNTKKYQIPPALGKSITNLESATRLALVENEARYLTDLCEDNLAGCLEKYIKFNDIDGKLVAHDGMAYTFKKVGDYYEVTLDVNGPIKGPNESSKDTFKLLINKKGVVIPFGSAEHVNNYGGTTWKNGNCDATDVKTPDSCAGSIVENSFKIIYKF